MEICLETSEVVAGEENDADNEDKNAPDVFTQLLYSCVEPPNNDQGEVLPGETKSKETDFPQPPPLKSRLKYSMSPWNASLASALITVRNEPSSGENGRRLIQRSLAQRYFRAFRRARSDSRAVNIATWVPYL